MRGEEGNVGRKEREGGKEGMGRMRKGRRAGGGAFLMY